MPTFGRAFRTEHFTLAPEILPVNNGAYGLPPTAVLKRFHARQWHEDAYPDRYMGTEQAEDVKQATAAMARFLDAEEADLVFVDNTSAGVNVVLRSFPFERGDKLLFPSTTYGACARTIDFLALRQGIVPVELPLVYPMSDDEVVAAFAERLKAEAAAGKPVRMCLFDAIISFPGIRLPFERIVEVCRQEGVLSFVDAAHALGQIPMSLRRLQPDFFVSNLHKWLMVPRGCAVLYVSRPFHRNVHTFPISHGFAADLDPLGLSLGDRFCFPSMGYTAKLATVPMALEFRREVCGGEALIFAYTVGLAQTTGETLAARWGTSVLNTNHPGSRQISMVNVELPVEPAALRKGWAAVVRKALLENHTFAPLFLHNDKLYVRFSCLVYTELADFVTAGTLIISALKQAV